MREIAKDKLPSKVLGAKDGTKLWVNDRRVGMYWAVKEDGHWQSYDDEDGGLGRTGDWTSYYGTFTDKQMLKWLQKKSIVNVEW